MRIRLAIPDHLLTPEIIEAALEATTLANEQAIRRGEVPLITDAIRRGVKWKPEPFLDGEHFDLSHQVARRGWGDCDDLAPWLAGELRASGEDPDARSRIVKTGKNRFHALVETSDGEILDPSRWAGMGKRSAPRNEGVVGMLAKPFAHPNYGALCVAPREGRWWARADLPWASARAHIASHARARSPEDALDRAIAGAICCGEAIDSDAVDRMRQAGEFLLSDVDEGHLGSLLVGAGASAPAARALNDEQMFTKYAHDFGHAAKPTPEMAAFLRKRLSPAGQWVRGGPRSTSPAEVAHLVRVWLGANGVPGDEARAVPDWKAIRHYVYADDATRARIDSHINEALHRGGGFFDDLGHAVTHPFDAAKDVFHGKGPLGAVFNPGQAAARAVMPKSARRVMDEGMDTAAQRGADIIAPGSGSVLSALNRGGGNVKAPGALRDRGGGVSVPLHHAQDDDQRGAARGGMTLYYHPKGGSPVVMRF